MPLYIDVLMVLNFLVDLLLLMGADRLCGQPGRPIRWILAAALGGIYGGICILPGVEFLSGTVCRILVLTGMGGIAFGVHRDAVRRCVLFVLLSMALGGVVVGLSGDGVLTLSGAALAVCGMCYFGFRRKVGAEFVPVEINTSDQRICFCALRDTGNRLVDPVTGKQILVVSPLVGKRLTGLEECDFHDPTALLGKCTGIRLIPFHSVGNPSGLLAAKRFTNVKIGRWQGSCLVAFSPNGFADNYDALTGGMQ